jgi:hypothetical protein
MSKRKISVSVISSTLVEVITALIIISTVFTLAIVIYLNVQRAGLSSRKISCYMMMDEVYAKTIKSNKFTSEQFDYEDVTVYQDVKNENNGLISIRLEARDADGKLLAEQKHFQYVPQE